MSKREGPHSEYLSLQILSGSSRPAFSGTVGEGDERCVTFSSPIRLHERHRIAGVQAGADFILDIDGGEINRYSCTVGNVSTGGHLDTGAMFGGSSGRFFPGDLDEIRIWNVEHAAADIGANKWVESEGKEAGYGLLVAI